MKVRPVLVAIPVALLFAVSACSSDSGTDSVAASPETSVAADITAVPDTTAGTAAAPAATDFNDADVSFAQNMIPHHQQAVEMATIALDPERKASAEVMDLASRIQGAQDPEIQLMNDWLSSWGKAEAMEGMDHSTMGGMAGMMTEAEMSSMEAASGSEFDKMWMTMMIAHHKGAIEMSKTEQTDGQSAEAKALAGKIITAQEAEIAEMTTLVGG